MNLAYIEALKAYKNNEVPVGAVLVMGDKVVSGYNKKEKTKVSIKHAELIVIEKMCKMINDWRLNDSVLYVTLEPCLMCVGAIIESRIKRVVIGCNRSFEKESFINLLIKNDIEVVFDVESDKCRCLLKKFFDERRK